MSHKTLLVANTSWFLYNFRLPLARAIREHGGEVVLVGPRDAYVEKLRAAGYRWVELDPGRGLNPFTQLRVLLRIFRLYRSEKPDAIHHFTIKCVLYGTIAARLLSVPAVLNTVSGLGHLFISRDWKVCLLRPFVLLAYALTMASSRVRLIFENADDLAVFRRLRLVPAAQAVLIRSCGVDVEEFTPAPPPDLGANGPVVLFGARLLHEKGIREFVECARILKAAGVRAEFQVAGKADPGNPSSVSEEELRAWRDEGLVELLGHVDPLRPRLAAASVVVLPSYREGVPKILLEAAAMEKPIVATDVPGCREVVEHEKNGFLVPPRNGAALAAAVRRLLEQPELRARQGAYGRAKVLREFTDREIARSTLQVYSSLGVDFR